MKTIVIGAGIIGALTSFELARRGAEVTVIDAGPPAGAATGSSFGWINASFYENEDHFRLRTAAIDAHHALAGTLSTTAVQWQGCLCWEERGAAFDAQFGALQALGYDVRCVSRAEFVTLEPQIRPPERALLFAGEGAADIAELARNALDAAMALGARLVTGVRVTGLVSHNDEITGVRWSGGVIDADRVVLATGTATERLLADVGVPLPMPDRPGLILRTGPMPPLLAHILVSPGQELRQLSDGRLLAPTAAAHQSDRTEKIVENPQVLADEAAARVSRLIGQQVTWETVSLAWRPVPGDGLPVIGSCGPAGLYVTTMHSGATLAPLVARMAATEITGDTLSNSDATLVAPYRPQRFRD
ncbi:NAD(P)/FAD-dependent oxidoreductase [Roseobacter ponti]|uniref:FAD-binding oxidoreductase n=1 Tax=Roseobacter ponti TaxID=1891787 RepID=A0A858ST42_9RHOB|nr:FAD-dependent oxidoreductase [Roseobacter ponti]QJF50982.1 FAD-binding oxidoreductase [Roseobacter ponti]